MSQHPPRALPNPLPTPDSRDNLPSSLPPTPATAEPPKTPKPTPISTLISAQSRRQPTAPTPKQAGLSGKTALKPHRTAPENSEDMAIALGAVIAGFISGHKEPLLLLQTTGRGFSLGGGRGRSS